MHQDAGFVRSMRGSFTNMGFVMSMGGLFMSMKGCSSLWGNSSTIGGDVHEYGGGKEGFFRLDGGGGGGGGGGGELFFNRGVIHKCGGGLTSCGQHPPPDLGEG